MILIFLLQFTIRELFESEGFKAPIVPYEKDCIDELENGFKGVILLDIIMLYMFRQSSVKL